jgi:putative MATE family efflux protein
MDQKKHSNQTLFQLTWPIFIELILTMLVGNIGQWMISNYSQDAVGGIGNANQILNLLVLTFSVISTSTTILVAQYTGSNNKEKISTVYTLSIFVNLFFSVVVSSIILIFNKQIFHFMMIDADLFPYAVMYLKLVGSFIFLQGLISAFSAIFKANRLTKQTMIISVAMNVITVFLNYLLITGVGPFPELGVAGVAIATNLGRFFAVLLYIYLFVKQIEIKMSFSVLKPFPKVELMKMLGIGIPSAGEMISYNLAQTVLMKFINTFGKHVVNAKVYSQMLAWFSYLYASAVGQASQIIVGNLMGAGEKEKTDKHVKKFLVASVLVAVCISTTIFLISGHLFRLFTDNQETIRIGQTILFIDIFLEIGKSTNITLVRCLQATGDIKFPMIIAISFMWIFQVGLGYILSVVFDMGLIGIWIAMATDELVRALIFIFRWRSGVWKKNHLAE